MVRESILNTEILFVYSLKYTVGIHMEFVFEYLLHCRPITECTVIIPPYVLVCFHCGEYTALILIADLAQGCGYPSSSSIMGPQLVFLGILFFFFYKVWLFRARMTKLLLTCIVVYCQLGTRSFFVNWYFYPWRTLIVSSS